MYNQSTAILQCTLYNYWMFTHLDLAAIAYAPIRLSDSLYVHTLVNVDVH